MWACGAVSRERRAVVSLVEAAMAERGRGYPLRRPERTKRAMVGRKVRSRIDF